MQYYIVKYTGPFGFIKPWTAVRDSETFSQQFLTPSIVEGMEKKLFPELLTKRGIYKIRRHRIRYDQISSQQEVIQTRGWNLTRQKGSILFNRPSAILLRGVLVNPVLFLAFESESDAKTAFSQHICLCRNEDILLPVELLVSSSEEFDTSDEYAGYELLFEDSVESFMVGYNRWTNDSMFGRLKIVGTPVNSNR